MKTNEIKLTATTQASYYGKAGYTCENGVYSLRSYATIVCEYDATTGVFTRLWGGYSVTTKNHVNDFRRLFGLPALSKKEWNALPVRNDSGERYKVEYSNGFFSHTTSAVFDDYDAAAAFAGDIERLHGGRVYAFPVEA